MAVDAPRAPASASATSPEGRDAARGAAQVFAMSTAVSVAAADRGLEVDGVHLPVTTASSSVGAGRALESRRG